MSIIFHKKKENYWVYGIGTGVIEAVYCFFIATLLMLANGLFAKSPTILSFLLLLLIMVFSVAVSGLLIFGYPMYLALRRNYQEAIFTVLVSIATLIIIGLLVIIIKIIF